MITGVQDVYYNVRDMRRAVAFYTGVLSMKVAFGDEYWTGLDCGGTRVGLHGTGGDAVPTVPRDPHGAHAGATLTLKSTDVGQDRKRLEGSGAKILGTFDELWGEMLVFEDLDGNVLKLMRPKK